jgi:imidazolonepropionase-like amidohydrolase
MRNSTFAQHAAFIAAVIMLTGCAANRAVPIAGPVEGNSFVVRDVRVFDGARTHERVHVVVRAGRIVSMGRTPVPSELPVIDGAGRTLLPGLINAHGHVPGEASLRNALRFGVTTVLDMLTAPEFARAQRALGRRDQLERTDLADLFTAGAPVTSPGGMGTQFGIPFTTITSPDEADALVRARIASGSDHIKIMYEPAVNIVTSISPATLAAVVRAAHAHGVLAVVHISSAAGARGAVAAGADGLAHVFSNEVIDDALVQQMRTQGMFVSSTLSIFAAFDGTGFGRQLAADPRIAPYLTDAQRTELTKAGPGVADPMAEYLARFNIERGIENIRRLHTGGVRILAGDDAPNLGAHGASLHGELELLTRAGLTPAQALHAATAATAEAFRLPERGRIAAGARADMILVEGNPLEDITATRAIVRIFKNGFEVPRDSVATGSALPSTPPVGGFRR